MKGTATKLTGLAVGLLFSACAVEPSDVQPHDEEVCVDGKCDFVDPLNTTPANAFPCDSRMIDNTGKNLGNKILGRLNDPYARLVLRSGNGCQNSLGEILKKLKDNPKDGDVQCDISTLRTMFITETNQLSGTSIAQGGSVRTVSAVDCGNDGRAGLLFSSNPNDFPDGGFLEVVAFDASAGVFNYYDRSGQNVKYHGHSGLFVTQPPASTGNTPRRCGGCHTGGGLIMKELAAPWLHWEGDTVTPGADDLLTELNGTLPQGVAQRKSDGIELESIVRSGNNKWDAKRFELLKQNTVNLPKAFNSILSGNGPLNPTAKLLEPLFCGTEVNIDTASSSGQDGTKGRATSGPLSGPVFSNQLGFGSLSFKAEVYDEVIKAVNQRVNGAPGNRVDTHFALPFISPSSSDLEFVQLLQQNGLIDDRIVQAVLLVDLTRSTTSTDRCELLRRVPNLPSDKRNPQGFRDALVNTFKNDPKGSPGKELANNLAAPQLDANKVTQTFQEKCNERIKKSDAEAKKVLQDYMTVVELSRDLNADRRSVFEFQPTLARDPRNINPNTRLNPLTCEITTSFVAISADFDRAASCVGRCGVRDEDQKCQCDGNTGPRGEDKGCEDRKDCCTDFGPQCKIPVCGHTVCVVGDKLDNKCADTALPADKQQCAAKVCAQDAFCCQSNFDDSCVNQAKQLCGITCPTSPPPPPPPGGGGGGTTRRDEDPTACKVCVKFKACGNGCIPKSATCDQPPGCAKNKA